MATPQDIAAQLGLVDPRLLLCGTASKVGMQDVNRSVAYLGGMMPGLLAVIFFSTPKLRRQWAFRILVFALIVQIARCSLGLQTIAISARTLDSATGWHTTPLQTRVQRAGSYMYIPWICDCALLCKLLAFHPAQVTSWKKRAAILAFPLTMHVLRLPLLIFLAVHPIDDSDWQVITIRLLIVEGALQVAENGFCSAFLLHKAYRFARLGQGSYIQRSTRLQRRLRYFTESILFTFLPASTVQLAYLILEIWAISPPTNGTPTTVRIDYDLRDLNIYFSVYFGLLAVWWTSARTDAPAREQTNGVKDPIDMSLIDWALGPIKPEAHREIHGLDELGRESSLRHRSSKSSEERSY